MSAHPLWILAQYFKYISSTNLHYNISLHYVVINEKKKTQQ